MQVDVLGMTAAGLLELTRRRGAPPLHDLLRNPPAAELSPATAACAILREILRLTGPGRPVVQAAPAVIAALEGPFAAASADVARRMGQTPVLKPDPARADWAVAMEKNQPL